MDTTRGTALIVGATGVVGNAALHRFLDDGWDVIAASRRTPYVTNGKSFTHVAIDLTSADDCVAASSQLAGVTHVVYAALYEKPGLIAGWSDPDQMATNDAMLRNLFGALEAAKAPVRHVSALQGTKAYGVHVTTMRIPAKERQPRVEHPNFYWLQEDFLRERSEANGFGLTIWRPQFIFGGPIGAAMNLVPVIGAYAAIRSFEGLPFAFPGGASYVAEAADARLIASAMAWAAGNPAAWNETYNITNGDCFEWRNLWPTLADDLGVEIGDEEPLLLAQWFEEKQGVWDEVTRVHHLEPVPLLDYLGESRYYGDFAFAYGSDGRNNAPAFVSTVKLRQAGFGEAYDTEDSFAYWFDDLRARRLLPGR
jgi:nucleoside-diphosphate-sugar epimerase